MGRMISQDVKGRYNYRPDEQIEIEGKIFLFDFLLVSGRKSAAGRMHGPEG